MKPALIMVAYGFAFAMFATAMLIAAAASNIALILFARIFSVH